MPVRIYALAKELKLDSKELVELCAKAGVSGKGSALASLSDDESEKVKAFIKGGSAPRVRKNKAAPPAAPEQPKRPAPAGKMPVLITKPKRKAAPRPAPLAGPLRKAVEPKAPEPAETVLTETVPGSPAEIPNTNIAAEASADSPAAAIETPVAPAPSETPTATPGAPERPMVRREDYIGPGGRVGKMPVLGGAKPRAGALDQKKPNGPGQRSRPAIKLAPLPAAEQPKAKPKKVEPSAQKPDMKLPAEIVRATTSGQSRPLAAHLRRAERVAEADRRRKEIEGAPPTSGDPAKNESDKRGKRGKGGASRGEKLIGGREQRQLRRNRSGQPARPRRITRRHRRTGANTAAPRKDKIVLELPCTVREFSEAAGVPANQIQRLLMDEGIMTTINARLDPELAELFAVELGAEIEFRHAQSLEEKYLDAILDQEDDPKDLVPRAPIITFLGHVDHGKTSLLDKIIGLDVVSGESGGITQHIRAYQVQRESGAIAFVDTPGHEAFTEMRARGANVTDIAVLVVAADDGIMPQTEEAISHARAAEVPIVVALNKIDIPGVNIDHVYQQLSTNELLPSEWGGDTEVMKTSAISGDGVDDLLETLLTVAELHEYYANPKRPGYGTCLESQQDSSRGIIAKLIVQNGTLRVGDVVVCGAAHGRIKAMYDTLNPRKKLKEAGPSTPVNVSGFDVAPAAGERFFVLDDISKARELATDKANSVRQEELSGLQEHITLETLFDRLDGLEEVQLLNVVIRADVKGSIEAIRKEFEKLDHPEVKIKILQASVGGISEADITLADASDAIVIGFNVVPDEGARQLAEARGVQVRRYSVIYKITDDLKAALEGLLKPEEKEVALGRALVQRAYKISRVGTIAGCRVLTGTVSRNARVRVIRDSTIIGDYAIDTLRRIKDDAKDVREGLECGIKLVGFNDVKESDVFEVYRVEEVERSFDD